MDELGDEEAKQGSSAGRWEKAGLQKPKKKMVWSVEISPDNQDDKDQGSSPSKDMIGVIDCGGGDQR